jgi:two-component system, NtrC family, nitrogen regulation response regulator NtrX
VDALKEYAWPGNVRELKNIIERMVILSSGDLITIQDLPPGIMVGDVGAGASPFAQADYKEARKAFEKQYILRRLMENNYNVPETAIALNMDRTTLYRKLKQLGINLEMVEQEKPAEPPAAT